MNILNVTFGIVYMNTDDEKCIFRPPRLKGIDRSSASSMEVTVGNLTVVITDYKPKKERPSSTDTTSQTSLNNSSNDSYRVDSPEAMSPPTIKNEMNGDVKAQEQD